MPLKKRNGLEMQFLQWNNCRRLQSVYEKDVHDMFDEWLEKQNTKKKASETGRGKQNKNGSEKN